MPYKLSTSLLILTFISQAVFSQHVAAVKGVGYKGFIFDSAHIVFKSVKGGMKGYTPSAADIDIVESVLKKTAVCRQRKKNKPGCRMPRHSPESQKILPAICWFHQQPGPESNLDKFVLE